MTIPSQIRYIQYFESFLATNFSAPYIFLIPKIVKYHINSNTTNIIKNFVNDQSYFISPNEFWLKYIRVGPFTSDQMLNIKICDFVFNNINLNNSTKRNEKLDIDGKIYNYFKIEFNDKVKIDSDIKISVNGCVNFSFWANLWYSTLNQIKAFLDRFHKDLFEDHKNRNYSFQKKFEDTLNRSNSALESSKRELVKNSSKSDGKNLKISRNLTFQDIENSPRDSLAVKDKEKEKKKNTHKFDHFSDSDDDSKNNSPRNSNNKLKHEPKLEDDQLIVYSEPNHDDNLFDIIKKLNHNTNLNILIKTINKILVNEGKKPFNKTDLEIFLKAKELDKFSKARKMHDMFEVSICYSLYE